MASFAVQQAMAQGSAPPPNSLANASLEDLMNIQVTSVSKKEQSLAKTGAAAFVISQEDIRRSGSTNVPDLLRMVPGVEVAQIDANRWAISIRGFNALYGNKVLVLVDGRSIYVDSISGVFWDQQDVPLEDIDHIEVIRGPGGTVWGANAVNGVINLITKRTTETKGGLLSAGGGSQTAADSLAQYGGSIGSGGGYRVFGRSFDVDNATAPDGRRAADGWRSSHGGFRTDWNVSPQDSLSVQGDASRSTGAESVNVAFPATQSNATLNEPVTNGLADALAKWEHTLGNGSQTSVQVYFDYTHRFGEGGGNEYHRTTDVEFEHHLSLGSRHDVVWGLGYRVDRPEFDNKVAYSLNTFLPSERLDQLESGFLQDEITLTRTLSLTVGSKIEHNVYTGFEYAPSAQLVWTPSDRRTFWASAARAIREPGFVEYAANFNLYEIPASGGNPPLLATLTGATDFHSEKLRDVAAGYRAQINKRLSLDLTAYLGYYRNLRTNTAVQPYFSLEYGYPHIVLPTQIEFTGRARNSGAESYVNWDVSNRLRFSAGYSWLTMSTAVPAQGTPAAAAGDNPHNQFQVRAFVNLRRNLEWDSSVAYVSALTGVPQYARVDSRLGWRMAARLEFSIVGQNLASPQHMEFIDNIGLINGTEVPRTVFAKATWRF
jgi:iron complex outermembrane receptor protein